MGVVGFPKGAGTAHMLTDPCQSLCGQVRGTIQSNTTVRYRPTGARSIHTCRILARRFLTAVWSRGCKPHCRQCSTRAAGIEAVTGDLRSSGPPITGPASTPTSSSPWMSVPSAFSTSGQRRMARVLSHGVHACGNHTIRGYGRFGCWACPRRSRGWWCSRVPIPCPR